MLNSNKPNQSIKSNYVYNEYDFQIKCYTCLKKNKKLFKKLNFNWFSKEKKSFKIS